MKRYLMGQYFYGNLFPITVKHKLNTKGYYEFKEFNEGNYERELIVGVWPDNTDDYHYDKVVEYLLCKITRMNKKKLYSAHVVGRLSKSNVRLDKKNDVIASHPGEGVWIDYR